MTRVYISSVGMTRFGKREEGLLDLMVEASEKALGELDNCVDALFVGCQNPEELTGLGNISTRLASKIGHTPRPAVRIENSSGTGSAVLMNAFMAVRSGMFESILVVAGEKMTGVSTAKATRVLAEVLGENEREHGLTMTALGAMAARRYMHDFGLSREDLALVPLKNHRNGALNPNAHFQKEVTLEKILESRLIAEPLRLFDIAPISDGAAAALVSSHGGAVEIKGIGAGTESIAVEDRDSLTSLKATVEAGRMAYAMADLGAGDIDVAELHDAFSILELINSEDLGFFPKGESWKALKKGDTQIGGQLPINTSGGLKARGHPVGATGLAQMCEIFWQLTDDAGKRQVDGAKTGLAQNIGGFGCNNVVTILTRC
jgi:acetyl-CoA C-acetyltransferase